MQTALTDLGLGFPPSKSPEIHQWQFPNLKSPPFSGWQYINLESWDTSWNKLNKTGVFITFAKSTCQKVLFSSRVVVNNDAWTKVHRSVVVVDSVDGRGEVGLWEENQTTDVGIFVDTLRELKIIPPWGKRKTINSKVPFLLGDMWSFPRSRYWKKWICKLGISFLLAEATPIDGCTVRLSQLLQTVSPTRAKLHWNNVGTVTNRCDFLDEFGPNQAKIYK